MSEGGEFSVDNPYAGEEAHFVAAFIGDVPITPQFGRGGELIAGGMLVGGTPPPMHLRPPAPAGEFAVDSPRVEIPVYDERGHQIGVSVVGTPVHDNEGKIVAVEGEDQVLPESPLDRLRALAGAASASTNGSQQPVSEDEQLFPPADVVPPTPRPLAPAPVEDDELAASVRALQDSLSQLRGEVADTVVQIGSALADLSGRVEAIEGDGGGMSDEVVQALTAALEAVNGRITVLTSFTERAVGTTLEAARAGSNIIGEI